MNANQYEMFPKLGHSEEQFRNLDLNGLQKYFKIVVNDFKVQKKINSVDAKNVESLLDELKKYGFVIEGSRMIVLKHAFNHNIIMQLNDPDNSEIADTINKILDNNQNNGGRKKSKTIKKRRKHKRNTKRKSV